MRINCITPKNQMLGFKAEEQKVKTEQKAVKAEIKPLQVFSDNPQTLMAQFALPALIMFPLLTKAAEMVKLMKPMGAKARFKHTVILAALTGISGLISVFSVEPARTDKLIKDLNGFAKELITPYKIMFSILKDKVTGKRAWNK